jgi:hypothetical protein
VNIEEDARRQRDELINVHSQRSASHWKHPLIAIYSSKCSTCGLPIKRGQLISGFGPRRLGSRPKYRHAHCA